MPRFVLSHYIKQQINIHYIIHKTGQYLLYYIQDKLILIMLYRELFLYLPSSSSSSLDSWTPCPSSKSMVHSMLISSFAASSTTRDFVCRGHRAFGTQHLQEVLLLLKDGHSNIILQYLHFQCLPLLKQKKRISIPITCELTAVLNAPRLFHSQNETILIMHKC